MRTLLAAVWTAALVLAGCQYCVEGAGPRSVSLQPLGARCVTIFECAPGLGCVGHLCTIRCAGAPSRCPEGSACVEGARESSGAPVLVCLPRCVADADCDLGAAVGWCLTGADEPFCSVRACRADEGCPAGARCVGVSHARGITWNETCEDGFCQR
ncbi:MAG: hypothetical protein U0229_17530 [Anaeromyxobacter sp.]